MATSGSRRDTSPISTRRRASPRSGASSARNDRLAERARRASHRGRYRRHLFRPAAEQACRLRKRAAGTAATTARSTNCARSGEELPPGIEVEFDEQFDAMFSYKAKNYALLTRDGEVIIKGGALKSRGLEKFQRVFLEEMIKLLMEGKAGRDRRLRTTSSEKSANANGRSTC